MQLMFRESHITQFHRLKTLIQGPNLVELNCKNKRDLQIEVIANQNGRKNVGKTNEELVFLAKVRRVEEVKEGRGPYWLFLQLSAR